LSASLTLLYYLYKKDCSSSSYVNNHKLISFVDNFNDNNEKQPEGCQ